MPHPRITDRATVFADFLSASGDIGRGILALPWEKTSLGPIGQWPDALRNTIRLVLGSRQRMVFFWGPDLLQFYNQAYEPTLDGMPDNPLGAPFRIFWGEVFEGVRPFYEQAMAGEGTWYENLPLTLTRNGVTEQTYWTFSYSPLHDDDGAIVGFLNVVTETTQAERDRLALDAANATLAVEYQRMSALLAERVEADKRMRVLQRELSHRMKNTLAMVQAMVAQSLRHATSIEDAAVIASERIQALGRAQDALTANSWDVADIAEVMTAALAPHADGGHRFIVDGPSLDLSAQQSMGLSLAIHELATNATKYGALSIDAGRVFVGWSLEDGDRFRFDWREQGGPAVSPPDRRGFGSRLTERVVPSYFQGKAHLTFQPDGVRFVLEGKL